MKNRMQKSYYQGQPVAGNRKRKGQEQRTKSSEKHPYQKDSFWANTTNHFWENANYSESSKEFFRNWLRTTTF